MPPLTLEQAVGQQFLLSFVGKEKPPEDVLAALRQQRMGGTVLFRAKNMGSLAELRGLTAALQAAAEQHHQPPLLIAADQEGGQLMAIGDGTPFPGNLALGAARSEKLAERVGRALGREVAAVGVNVNLAPVCDVNNNPENPVVGTRSFGEDPALVARLAAALVRGIQSAGVAAMRQALPRPRRHGQRLPPRRSRHPPRPGPPLAHRAAALPGRHQGGRAARHDRPHRPAQAQRRPRPPRHALARDPEGPAAPPPAVSRAGGHGRHGHEGHRPGRRAHRGHHGRQRGRRRPV